MIRAKDYEGGRKIGRLSLMLSLVSIIVGSAILLYVAMTGNISLCTHTEA